MDIIVFCFVGFVCLIVHHDYTIVGPIAPYRSAARKHIFHFRERERERERAREREREINVFIGNSTSWITNLQGAKYKIQVNSNRHISYIMYKYNKHQPCHREFLVSPYPTKGGIDNCCLVVFGKSAKRAL